MPYWAIRHTGTLCDGADSAGVACIVSPSHLLPNLRLNPVTANYMGILTAGASQVNVEPRTEALSDMDPHEVPIFYRFGS